MQLVREDLRNKQLQEPVHVDGSLMRVDRDVIAFVDVGETHIDGLVDEKHGRIPRPPPWIVVGAIPVLVDQTGAHFLEQPEHTGAARPTCHPQGQRIIFGVVLTLKVPEEQMLRPNVEPAGVLC